MVNQAYLSDVHQVTGKLCLHTNAGTSRTNTKGYLGNTPFWLDRFGIGNVMSLKTLKMNLKVTYNSKKHNGAFVIHTKDGPIMAKRCPRTSFPFIDLTDEDNDPAILFIQSIRQNYEGFTREEVKRAIEARKLQARSGNPSEAAYKDEVSRTLEPNALFSDSAITTADINNARKIFGPSLPCLQGKWTRGKPTRVELKCVSVPRSITQ